MSTDEGKVGITYAVQYEYDVTVIRFGLVYWCLMALSAQTGYIVPQEYEYYVGPGEKTNTQLSNEITQ